MHRVVDDQFMTTIVLLASDSRAGVDNLVSWFVLADTLFAIHSGTSWAWYMTSHFPGDSGLVGINLARAIRVSCANRRAVAPFQAFRKFGRSWQSRWFWRRSTPSGCSSSSRPASRVGCCARQWCTLLLQPAMTTSSTRPQSLMSVL